MAAFAWTVAGLLVLRYVTVPVGVWLGVGTADALSGPSSVATGKDVAGVGPVMGTLLSGGRWGGHGDRPARRTGR